MVHFISYNNSKKMRKCVVTWTLPHTLVGNNQLVIKYYTYEEYIAPYYKQLIQTCLSFAATFMLYMYFDFATLWKQKCKNQERKRPYKENKNS